MTKTIGEFVGEYRFLSNFYSSPILYEGKEYPSAEHLYQALKTTDLAVRETVRLAPNASAAKKLGKKVKVRPDWSDVKLSIMRTIVTLKFNQNPELAEKLKATGDAKLIEGNWWNDTYWGECNGIGQNNLGILLQEVRSQLNG